MKRILAIVVLISATGLLSHIAGGHQLASVALLAFSVQFLAFLPAWWFQTEKFYDLAGSLTYLLLLGYSVVSAEELSFRGAILCVCVATWAIRLGSFLASRVVRAGKDRRFDEIKRDGPRFAVAWALQGVWTFLTPLPVWLVLQRAEGGWGALDALGLLLWSSGLMLEIIADHQKTRFRADAANQRRFIKQGVWSWSRHPNYFGEIVLWLGVFLMASSQLRGLEWLAALSPVFVTLLLVRGSGIPLLEAHADAKWGGQADYEAYKSRTNVLIPRPPR